MEFARKGMLSVHGILAGYAQFCNEFNSGMKERRICERMMFIDYVACEKCLIFVRKLL